MVSIVSHGTHKALGYPFRELGAVLAITDLPTVLDFPAFSRNSATYPGVPEKPLFVLHS